MEKFLQFDYYSHRVSGDLGDVYVRLSDAATAEERFTVTRDALSKHGVLPTAMLSAGDVDPAAAVELRELGNAFFRRRKYYAAIEKYTASLLASGPGTECRALALANRSAALYHGGHHVACLADVDRALASAYPAGLAYKLYERAGRAEHALGRGDRARRRYAMCLERLDVASLSDDRKNALRSVIAGLVEECSDGPTGTAAYAHAVTEDEPPLLGGPNECAATLSNCVEFKVSKKMGRGVYAVCDIQPGDVVAIDEPYLSGPAQHMPGLCHYLNCLKIVLAVIPCEKCLTAVYCDEECMQKDYENHHLICPVLPSIKTLPGAGRVNELVISWFLKECSQMGLEKYCSVTKDLSTTKIDPKTRGFDENGQYNSHSFLAAYTVDVGANKLSKDVIFFFNCVCAELIQYLILSGFNIPKHYLATVGASLVHMFGILDFNCWKMNNLNSPNINCLYNNSLFSLTRTAFYTTFCLFNHSCDANLVNSGCIKNKQKVLRAVQPIPKGKQLFISYGCSFKMLNKKSRKKYCRALFMSKCYCQPCLEDWPTERYFPIRLSPQNIINDDMTCQLLAECEKFASIKVNLVTHEDYHRHMNYFCTVLKLFFANVKRPFCMYEECVKCLMEAFITFDSNEDIVITQFYEEIDEICY